MSGAAQPLGDVISIAQKFAPLLESGKLKEKVTLTAFAHALKLIGVSITPDQLQRGLLRTSEILDQHKTASGVGAPLDKLAQDPQLTSLLHEINMETNVVACPSCDVLQDLHPLGTMACVNCGESLR